MKKRFKKISIGIFCLLFISMLLIVWYKIAVNNQNKYIGTESFKEFVIQTGDSVDFISGSLEKENLIKSKPLFKLHVVLNRNKPIQAGRYLIPTNYSISQILDLIKRGSFEKKLTFIEGWRLEEYAEYLEKQMGIGNGAYAREFMKDKSTAEGYMFPDTYFFFDSAMPQEISKKLRETFDLKTADVKIKAAERKLNWGDVVVLASILERESAKEADRGIVGSILVKRYINGWPLQADATVQYIIGNTRCTLSQADCNWWPKVKGNDLVTESAYNTYINTELPPTPICNPSLSSITAIVNYSNTPYWFYITDKTGTTHYAKTIEEHNKNISLYLN